MEQVTTMNATRRSGWSDAENRLLWETADEAQQQGLPLKSVFESIAAQTGRRPNSIRNYYYAQVRQRDGSQARPARFVPFSEQEVEELMERVLRERARGCSVRACLQRLAAGDHSLMLRYQNKYRSVLKSRPELVQRIVEKLKTEGVEASAPQVNHRPRVSLSEACAQLVESTQVTGSPELVRACETLTQFMLKTGQSAGKGAMSVRLDMYKLALEDHKRRLDDLHTASEKLVGDIKEFLGQPQQARGAQLDAFCDRLTENLGQLEEAIE